MYWEEFLSSMAISTVKNAGLPRALSFINSSLFMFHLEDELPFSKPQPPEYAHMYSVYHKL